MGHVLVIEDNRTNLDLMVFLLKAYGHDVRGSRSGEEGLAAARDYPPDLILLDVNMPVMDGYEVVHQLKDDQALRHVPVVAVTALAMVGDRERILRAGFDGYIAKPIDPHHFLAEVRGHLPDGADIPFSAAYESSAPTPAAPPPVSRRGRILVVDNTPANLQLMQAILEPVGFEVLTATSVDQGLALARERRPDIILSDVHMPGQSGHEFARLVRADPSLTVIPFILVSSTSEPTGPPPVFTGAAEALLVRPVAPAVLVDVIEKTLRRRSGPP